MSESDLLLLLLLLLLFLLFLLFLASSYFPSNSSSSRHRDWRLSILRHLGSPIPLRPTDPSEQARQNVRARSITFSLFFSSFFFFISVVYRLRSPLLLPFPRPFHLASASPAFCCHALLFVCSLFFRLCRFDY